MEQGSGGGNGEGGFTPEEIDRIVRAVDAAPKEEQAITALRIALDIFPDDNEFIFKFFKIVNKDAVVVPFKANRAQLILNEVVERMAREGKKVRVIVLKARQLGCSVWVQARLLMKALRKPNINALVIADKENNARFLFAHGKRFFDSIPFKPKTKYSTKEELIFEEPHNSTITIESAKNVDAGRSRTIHHIHGSEVASWDRAEELMVGLAPSLTPSKDSWMILESTAKGIGGFFHKTWKGAEKGENNFEPVFLPWWLADEYTVGPDSLDYKAIEAGDLDEEEFILRDKFHVGTAHLAWRRQTIRNDAGGSVEWFHQEHPSTPQEAFLVSGRPVFPMAKLEAMEALLEDPRFCVEVETDSEAVSL